MYFLVVTVDNIFTAVISCLIYGRIADFGGCCFLLTIFFLLVYDFSYALRIVGKIVD